MSALPMMLLIFWLVFGLLIQPVVTVSNEYINRAIPDSPTHLSSADFQLSPESHTFQQTFDYQRVYRSDMFEGDITGLNFATIHNFISTANWLYGDAGSSAFIQRAATKSQYNLWPKGEVPYVVSSQYSNKSRALLARAVEDFEARTCLKFVPKTDQSDYVYIKPYWGCASYIGRVGGMQILSLDNGCLHHGTILHEMMHAVGFFHEQSRNDRDNYIQVMYQNILPGKAGNFAKYSLTIIDHLGTPYDYRSVMHYGKTFFSRNGQPTIVPIQAGVKIGQRVGFSKLDTERVNKLYSCHIPAPPPAPPPPTATSGPSPPPQPTSSKAPSTTPGRMDPCYHQIENSTHTLRIERGCYRVVRFRKKYIVAHCTHSGVSDFFVTRSIHQARWRLASMRQMQLKRCEGQGFGGFPRRVFDGGNESFEEIDK